MNAIVLPPWSPTRPVNVRAMSTPEPEGHRGVSLAPNRILRDARPRVADLRPAYWRLRPWAKFRARVGHLPCGVARLATSGGSSRRNCLRRAAGSPSMRAVPSVTEYGVQYSLGVER